MTKKKVIFSILLILFILSFNDLLGWIVAELGRGEMRYADNGKVFIYENTKGVTAFFIKNVLKTTTFTLGHFIISASPKINFYTYEHELVHVKQYELLGPFFLPAYLIAHGVAFIQSIFNDGINIHDANIFERWANEVAGL